MLTAMAAAPRSAYNPKRHPNGNTEPMAATVDTLRIAKRLRDTGVLATKAELAQGLAEIRAEMSALEQRLSNRITEAQADVIKWLVPLLLGQTALNVTLVKLLPG
jgi:hypothetical protein